MKKHKVNFEDFIKLNNPYHVYILGLLWADGHVTFANNKAKTPLIKHTSILDDSEDFLPIFNNTGEWKHFIYENKKLNYKKIRIINTSNRPLGQWLIDNRYREKNSYPLFLNSIDSELLKYFFRGLSDGDGCFTITLTKYLQFYLSGSCAQDWSFVTNLLNKLGIDFSVRSQKNSKGCSSQIRLNNKNSIKWGDYIYSGENFGLNRKYEKWLKIKNYYSTCTNLKQF